VDGVGDTVRSVNLSELLLSGARPDADALTSPAGGVSYSSLAALTERMGGSLVEAGVSPGDRVGIASANDVEFVVAYLAALHVGALAVPLNPSAPPAELERDLAAVEPRVVLAAGPAIGMCGAAGAPVRPIDLDALPEARAPRAERADADVAVLLFTSGTAGAPKAAMLTHGNLAANIRQVQEHPGLALEPSDVVLAVLPFHHVFGLNVALGVSLAAGARVVLEERFDAGTSARHVAEQGVTVIAGVPTMYASWLALADDDVPADAFATVRLAVSGAAPLPDPVATAFAERYGVPIHQGYGLTEASPIVTTTALGGGPPRPGSIGPPIPGVELRLVDADDGDVLVGDPGEIYVRGPNVFPGYWQDPEATERALAPEGWLRTGDIAVIEDDGELRLVDRAKDLVIVSGFNVFPVEVEDVLRAHTDVADAAVVGEESARTGEAVVAYVQAKPGHDLDTDALAGHVARALARYKCPSRYVVVEQIPRNVAGKLLRRELR